MSNAVENPTAKAQKSAADLMMRLDADKNGELTEEELIFATADGNHDVLELLLKA